MRAVRLVCAWFVAVGSNERLPPHRISRMRLSDRKRAENGVNNNQKFNMKGVDSVHRSMFVQGHTRHTQTEPGAKDTCTLYRALWVSLSPGYAVVSLLSAASSG